MWKNESLIFMLHEEMVQSLNSCNVSICFTKCRYYIYY